MLVKNIAQISSAAYTLISADLEKLIGIGGKIV
jgi:hypothetical protein